jgi:hypothetical protein
VPHPNEGHAERVAFGTMSDDTSKKQDPHPLITTSGLQVASRHGRFEEGHPPSGGRPKGSRTRIKADLSQMILNGAAAAGFLRLDKDGKRVATGMDGCDGYLLWCAVNEPRPSPSG